MSNKTIPAISIESQEVIRRLEKAEVGEVVSYAELNKICMGDVQDGKRHVLSTARNRLRRDRHMVFECVANEGLKRVTDDEIVDTSGEVFRRMNRMSKRTLEKLSCVNYDKLDAARRIQHNAVASLAGIVSYATTSQKVKAITGVVEKANARLALKDTLAFFTGNGEK